MYRFSNLDVRYRHKKCYFSEISYLNRTQMETVLYTLKNSVEKHLVDKNTEDLKSRVNTTVDELKKMSKELWKLGCRKTAIFIREYSNSMMVFAKFAVNGRKVPWNSNIIERLMGEIAKRTKHKWMRWTTKGLETIINIILVRYCSEEHYEEFKNVIMRSENLMFINLCSVNDFVAQL